MRRFAVCLLFLLLAPAFTASRAARRADTASSAKGQVEAGQPADCSGTSPYANFRFSLPTEESADPQYSASVKVLGWGNYVCPDNVTLTEQASSESTILAINITPPSGHAFVLQSFRLNSVLANPGVIFCGNTGLTPCEVLGTVTPGSNQPLGNPLYNFAAAVSGADGTGTVWSFGNVATTDPFPIFGAEYMPGGPYLFQPATMDPTSIVTAAVQVGGCAKGQSTPAGVPPLPAQTCIGVDPITNLSTSYANSLVASTTYSIVLMDTTNGSTVTIGAPTTLDATSGAAHDVSSNPVSIPSGAVINQIFDLSKNYPLENASGGQMFDPNNPSQTLDPPPCAGSACPGGSTLLPYHSVWFEFTSANGSNAVPVTVNTAYSHYDTVLSVFTGQPGAGLTPLPNGFNDDNPAATPAQNQSSSLVTFTANPSTKYYILVSEYPPMAPQTSSAGYNYTSPLNIDPTLYLTLTSPQLTPSPSTLASFGSATVGSTSAAQQVTLTAQYSAAVGGISSKATISGDFQITSPACTSPLADGTACTLTVVFTPTAAGLRTGTLTITSNAENSPLTFELSGTGAPPPPLTITPATLPVAVIGSTYSGTLQATGGIPPYDWTVVSGSLPTNFSLQGTTGVISGSPTQTGTSSFTIQVSDSESPAATTTAQLTLSVEEPNALRFVPIAPCRIADTRNATGPFGGPAIAPQETRSFAIPQSACGIPSAAAAYALNVTVVPQGPLDFLTVWPAGQAQPTVSLLNSIDGRVKANAAIIPAGVSGAISVYPAAQTPTHVVIDISGYFVPATASGLAFYPLTPCRIADTRNADGPFGGPSLLGSRAFAIQASDCNVPASATAYSLNITAIPKGPLNYVTLWPTGQTQPTVSTLNAVTGTVTANAAIVPGGSGGQVSVFVTNDADIVMDINGYFGSPAPGGTSLYTTTPCRVLDTREYPASPFPGTYTVGVLSSSCTLPASASAYVLNATVVPTQPLGYLSLWPAGESQPVVSTLNAVDGSVTSNMAIVPTNNGSIDADATNATQLILDISSFFAP